MTLKERVIPWKLQQLRAIERRIAAVPAKLKEDLNLYESGYRGEQNLDYHLSFLQGEDFEVLHDLRLRGENGFYFQIDCLVVTPHVLVIVEVKNMVGRFQFRDELGQMVRVWRGEEVVMPNPLNQIWRQQSQLSGWLVARQMPLVSLESLLVFSHPSAVIQSSEPGTQALSKVIYAEGIVPRLEQLKSRYSKTRTFLQPSVKEKLVKLLVENHSPLLFSVLDTYHIHPTQIQKGVHCPQCQAPFMIRIGRSGKWHCKKCKSKSKHAHIQALEDYYLLFKRTITNAELRDYLGLDSKMAANRILDKLNLQRVYSGRHCYYKLTYPLKLK